MKNTDQDHYILNDGTVCKIAFSLENVGVGEKIEEGAKLTGLVTSACALNEDFSFYLFFFF